MIFILPNGISVEFSYRINVTKNIVLNVWEVTKQSDNMFLGYFPLDTIILQAYTFTLSDKNKTSYEDVVKAILKTPGKDLHHFINHSLLKELKNKLKNFDSRTFSWKK